MNAQKVKKRVYNSNAIPREANRPLTEAIDNIAGHTSRIEGQRESVQSDRYDQNAPSEGQWPGYNNQIRISSVKTINQVQRGIDEMNAHHSYYPDEIKNRKLTLLAESKELINQLSAIPKEDALDEKEAWLHEVGRLIDRTVDLYEMVEEQ